MFIAACVLSSIVCTCSFQALCEVFLSFRSHGQGLLLIMNTGKEYPLMTFLLFFDSLNSVGQFPFALWLVCIHLMIIPIIEFTEKMSNYQQHN